MKCFLRCKTKKVPTYIYKTLIKAWTFYPILCDLFPIPEDTRLLRASSIFNMKAKHITTSL